MAGEPQSSGSVGHGSQAGIGPVRRDRDGKAGHVEPAFSLGQLARLQPHDVGPVLGKDMRQAGHEAKLVAAADRDPVRNVAGLIRPRVEHVRDDPHLRCPERRELHKPLLQGLQRKPVRQLANGP